jgi:radical SAM protein with 4Fe4S-binding SPASM domain
MSYETALKVVDYIKAHCGGKKVSISWFGGEPLFNMEAIETICDGLRQNGIEFKSTMVSNGYLFDAQTVQKAVEQWNLYRVQITLDGTERVYNKTKAFIYREGSPYQVVLNNMERLLDAEVSINVRLNMDLYNASDLLQLMDELAKRFSGRKGLTVYAHHLFQGNLPMAEQHTEEEWQARDEAMKRLEEKIRQNGFGSKRGISKNIRLNNCMADSGKSVTILPDGNIGLCEHYSESEFIGHIDREGFDAGMVASWKERVPEIPECAECFYYPDCTMLKKCANASVCFEQYRQERYRKLYQAMACEFEKWKSNTVSDEEEEAEIC